MEFKAVFKQVGERVGGEERGGGRGKLRRELAAPIHTLVADGFVFILLVPQVEAKVSELGPWGYVLFAAVYVAAEILAVPALPLTGR